MSDGTARIPVGSGPLSVSPQNQHHHNLCHNLLEPTDKRCAVTNAPEPLLAHHLKMLRLPTFLREHDKQARICAVEGVDQVRYLARLTELELIDHERRMVERRIKFAKFPAVKSSTALTSRQSHL